MLVNIWGTIVHLSDRFFSGADDHQSVGLDLVISELLRERTNGKQVWMINPCYLTPGTSAALLRDSYAILRDSHESHLVLVSMGYSDVVHSVPATATKRHLDELGRRCRMFDKRIITMVLPVPSCASLKIARGIDAINRISQSTAKKYGGMVSDLRGLSFTLWDEKGSKPVHMSDVGESVADAILKSHASHNQWTRLVSKKR